MATKYADSQNVFTWPEFEALADRLGLDRSVPLRSLHLYISLGDVVTMDAEFLGRDMLPDNDAPPADDFDLTKATARIKRVANARGTQEYTREIETAYGCSRMLAESRYAAELEQVFLAAQPADDDEPIQDWWYTEKESRGGDTLKVKWSPVELWIELGNFAFAIKESPTRGDVRRLCDALGVPLK